MAPHSLASAVVLPSATPSPPPQTGTKRAQPEDTEHPATPKRQRTSPSPPQNVPRTEPSPPVHPSRARKVSTPAAAKPPVADETRDKRRNQRLFGALLGGLAGGGAGARVPRDSAVAKRRQEQEERRLVAARKRAEEIGRRQEGVLEELRKERMIQQRRIHEVNVRVRHANLRAMAGFLRTEAEPRLYYRPWKLREEDEVIIEGNRKDVELLIDEELDDLADLKRKWREEDEKTAAAEGAKSDEQEPRAEQKAVGETKDLEVMEKAVQEDDKTALPGTSTIAERKERRAEDAANAPVVDVGAEQRQRDEQDDEETKASLEDAGDIVVEGEEDTVIY